MNENISFIFWNENTNKFGLICKRIPCLDERINESGMSDLIVENGEVYLTTAFNDIFCESDSISEKEKIFLISNHIKTICQEQFDFLKNLNINYVGKNLISTQDNQFCYLFLIHVREECKNLDSIVWLTVDEVIKTVDWKSKLIVLGEWKSI